MEGDVGGTNAASVKMGGIVKGGGSWRGCVGRSVVIDAQTSEYKLETEES